MFIIHSHNSKLNLSWIDRIIYCRPLHTQQSYSETTSTKWLHHQAWNNLITKPINKCIRKIVVNHQKISQFFIQSPQSFLPNPLRFVIQTNSQLTTFLYLLVLLNKIKSWGHSHHNNQDLPAIMPTYQRNSRVNSLKQATSLISIIVKMLLHQSNLNKLP